MKELPDFAKGDWQVEFGGEEEDVGGKAKKMFRKGLISIFVLEYKCYAQPVGDISNFKLIATNDL